MQQQKIKSHYDHLTPLDAAFAILYVNRLSFSGIVKQILNPILSDGVLILFASVLIKYML